MRNEKLNKNKQPNAFCMFDVRELYHRIFAHSNCYTIIQISKRATVVIINL